MGWTVMTWLGVGAAAGAHSGGLEARVALGLRELPAGEGLRPFSCGGVGFGFGAVNLYKSRRLLRSGMVSGTRGAVTNGVSVGVEYFLNFVDTRVSL